MINNTQRIGNFTSSEIFALLSKDKSGKNFGKPALTYIEEKNMERRLGLSLNAESNAKPLSWGKFLEAAVFELLGMAYTLSSTETEVHPTIPFWAGSADLSTVDSAGDIKCPITRKSFCQLVQPLYDGLTRIDAMMKVRETHADGEKYYWQIVSNACILNKKYGELIPYMPFQSELSAIRSMAEGNKNLYWLWSSSEDELPFLKDDGYYRNINIIRFEIPESDKELLTEKVEAAGKLLIPFNNEKVKL